jgi:hypothetical protein
VSVVRFRPGPPRIWRVSSDEQLARFSTKSLGFYNLVLISWVIQSCSFPENGLISFFERDHAKVTTRSPTPPRHVIHASRPQRTALYSTIKIKIKMTQAKIDQVLAELDIVKLTYERLLELLPSFEVASTNYLPYGLKPHTRSVSWIVEQVITQQTKFRMTQLELSDVDFDLPDTCLHDCVLTADGKKYFINIKIHNMDGKNSKNDIAAVQKLYTKYKEDPNYNLIYACFGIRFESNKIKFDPDYLKIFSPQFLPVYVNPTNDKIQATYHHESTIRTRNSFLDLLVTKSKSILLSNDHR